MKPRTWTVYACIYVAIFLAQFSPDSATTPLRYLRPNRSMGEVVAAASWMQEGPKRGVDGDHALAPATKKPAANKKGKGKGDLYHSLIKLVAKLCLNDARELANIAGTVFQTWEMLEEAKSSGPKIMIEAGLKYDEVSKALKVKSTNGEAVDYRARGPPHVQVWAALCLHLVNNMDSFLEGSDVHKASESKVFKDYFEKYMNTQTPTQVAKHVLHFRYRKYKGKKDQDPPEGGKKGRLTFAFSYDGPGKEARSLLTQFLNNEKVSCATQLVGPAPRGPLEREAARILSLIERGNGGTKAEGDDV